MFRSFFLDRRWLHWSLLGSVLILGGSWYQVQLDVKLNEWLGGMFNLIQDALAKPGSIDLESFLLHCLTFAEIASLYVAIAVILDFYTKHFIFRWRTAMNDYYTAHWHRLRHIEGAAQRVQEDTMRFAQIMESLGSRLLGSVMTLAAFLPLLWTLSKNVTELPWIGAVSHALVYVAILFALAGTVLLALVGYKLPGLQFENQKVEAAYRKELVYGEDHGERADPASLTKLFGHVRRNYFRLFFHYMYFDVAKWSYLQFGAIVPYIALGPTIVAGVITLGVLQQIIQAFQRVESSLQYLVYSWSTIVELISVYKRLKAFEAQIKATAEGDPQEQMAPSTV